MRPGYKQTAVGMIPEDWDQTTIGAVCQILGRIGFRGYTVEDIVSEGQGAISLSPSNIRDSKLTLENKTFISWAKWEESPEIKIYDGDTILVKTGSTVGKASFVDGLTQPATLNPQMVVLKKSKIDKRLLGYLATSEGVQKQLTSTVVGGALPTLSQRQIATYKFACPQSADEQRAIAEVLSDADAAIAGLERLIAKKRDLKQAAMQQLLTGQTRLPGFSGEWEVKRIEETMDCLDNLRVPLNESERSKRKGDIPYCGANGVLDFVDHFVIDDDIILMAEDGGYFDEYRTRPIAYRMTGKAWVNNHAHILKAKPGIDQGFMYFALVHKNILSFLASGTRAKLNKAEMNKIEVVMPRSVIEQSAIAQILSDIDAELMALLSQLDKMRMIKQAMMQELLTGRTRLPIKEVVDA